MTQSACLFDYRLRNLRKDKARQTLAEASFLAQEIENVLWQRVQQLQRSFTSVLVIGCPTGEFARRMIQAHAHVIFAEEKEFINREVLPFQAHAFDLVVDGFGLHWVNDLPRAFHEVQRVLVPDGIFLAGFLGESTLKELRQVLIQTDLEFFKGVYARISPYLKLNTLSELLMAIGFQDPVVDHEEIEVHYPSVFELIKDLRNMGETNCLKREHVPYRRNYFHKANQLYFDVYATPQGKIKSTFDIVYLLAENRKGDIRQEL